MGIPKWLRGKESTCNAGDVSSTLGSGKPLRGGNGNPLQYSCLENPMDRGAWWATVHGVTTSRTGLNDWPSPCILKMILEHVTHFRESNELSRIFCVFSLERAFYTFGTSQFGQATFKDLAQCALHGVVTRKCLATWEAISCEHPLLDRMTLL